MAWSAYQHGSTNPTCSGRVPKLCFRSRNLCQRSQERHGYVHPVFSAIQPAGCFTHLSHRHTEFDERRDAPCLSTGRSCDLAGRFLWASFWIALPSHVLRLDFRRSLFSMGRVADHSRYVHCNNSGDLADDSLLTLLVSSGMDDWPAHRLAFIYSLCDQFAGRRRCVATAGIPIHVVDRAGFLFVLWNLPSQAERVYVFPEQFSNNAFCLANQQSICLDHVADRRWIELSVGYTGKHLMADIGRHPWTCFYHDCLAGIVICLLSRHDRVVAVCV